MTEQSIVPSHVRAQPDKQEQKSNFLKKAKVFFTGFETDETAKKQFFGDIGLVPPEVEKLSYLFHGTNERHRASRSTSPKVKKDPIFWADSITRALFFIESRIFEKAQNMSQREFNHELRDDRELWQPVLYIAKAKDILRDIKTGKREKIDAELAEEVMQTTGELQEEQVLTIRTSSELEKLEDYFVQKDPRLKKYFSVHIQRWKEHEKRVGKVEQEIGRSRDL